MAARKRNGAGPSSDEDDQDRILQNMISNDQSEPESGSEPEHSEKENDENEHSQGEDAENSGEDSDLEEDDEAYRRKRKNKKRSTAARFFDESASDDDECSVDGNSGLNDEDDSSEDGDKFHRLYNWGYGSDEDPWDVVEVNNPPSPFLKKLRAQRESQATPTNQLPITWTGNRRLTKKSFTRFQELPFELRLQIWELAFDEIKNTPRLLPVHYSPRSKPRLTQAPELQTFTAGLRVFMSINQETRSIGAEKFPETLIIDGYGTLRFNPSRDVVWFQAVRSYYIKDEGAWPVIDGICDKIENLALNTDDLFFNRYHLRGGNMLRPLLFFNSFSKLKNIFLNSELIKNPVRVCDWMQSDLSVNIRNITAEYTGYQVKTPFPTIYSFPDIWNATETLAPRISGCRAAIFGDIFDEFVSLAESLAEPTIFPEKPQFEMLAQLRFWPLITNDDTIWPPCVQFENHYGGMPRTPDDEYSIRMPPYCNVPRMHRCLGLSYITHGDDDSDYGGGYLSGSFTSSSDFTDEDDMLLPESSNDDAAAVQYLLGIVSENRGSEEEYESDFIVGDGEVEFDEHAGDSLLDDDENDDEDNDEDNDDNNGSALSGVPRPIPNWELVDTGYAGVTVYRQLVNEESSAGAGHNDDDDDDDDEEEEVVLVSRPRNKRRRVICDESDEEEEEAGGSGADESAASNTKNKAGPDESDDEQHHEDKRHRHSPKRPRISDESDDSE
ncbi:hypothetical protein BROUX41_005887 [Berkeleyomyces rouxiae]|uniref:uncharacterized protein n=1 Tax=Berkeleyomyces rouxiae TaxID=2035830 RepID=UPI003B7C0A2B